MTTYVQIDADSLRTLLTLAENRWESEKPFHGRDTAYRHNVKNALAEAHVLLRAARLLP